VEDNVRIIETEVFGFLAFDEAGSNLRVLVVQGRNRKVFLGIPSWEDSGDLRRIPGAA